MSSFYLVPHFEQMKPRDIYLLGFYMENIVVPDGLMWWKFYKNNIPLLSHVSQEVQAKELFRVAKESPAHRDVVDAYAELARAKILNHVWLASDSWSLPFKRTDSTVEREAIACFNAEIKKKRYPEIIHKVREACLADPTVPDYLAIRHARQVVGNELINKILKELQDKHLSTDSIEKKLRSRFAEHLRVYLRPERFAHKWALSKSHEATSYAGYLADVVNDFEYNHDLIPILVPSEIGPFLAQINKETHRILTHNQSLQAQIRQSTLAYQLGFNTLNALPDIGFQGIDEVLRLKEKLGEELSNYNIRMRQIADTILAEPNSEEAFIEIRSRINRELLPAINGLERRIEQCKPEIDHWLIPGVIANVGSLVISSIIGVPIEMLIGIAAGTIVSLGSLGSSIISKRRKLDELLENPTYFGLSLTLNLRKRQ